MEKTYIIQKYTLTFFGFIIIIGSLIYYFYKLNLTGIVLTFLISIILLFLSFRFNKNYNSLTTGKTAGLIKFNKNSLFYVAYLFFWIICLVILFANTTVNSIISPWEMVPSYFFVFYLLATFFLIINIIYNNNFLLILIIFHYFLSFSVLAIVFRVGYGFDPFIHRASINYIIDNGAIEPKTLYYIGQYSLEIFFSKFIPSSLLLIDKFLVPVLCAITLPIALSEFGQRWFSGLKKTYLAIILFLILPFGFCLLTVPQNLAYLFLVLTIIYGLSLDFYLNNKLFWPNLFFIYILALSSLFIQPIAGVPAIFFCLLLTLYYLKNFGLKKYIYGLIFLLSLAIFPALFYFLQKTPTSSKAVLDFNNYLSLLTAPLNPSSEGIILNLIYLFRNNLIYIIFVIILIGFLLFLKHKKKCQIFWLNFGLFVSFFISYIIVSALPFGFLIEYERSFYADRLLTVALIFLLPFIFLFFYVLIGKILSQKNLIKFSFLVFLTILIAINLYLTYPRKDNYFNSRSYSVGISDVEAVNWINNDAPNDNYIVLANQQVSAAALNEFGFKKYYPTNNEAIFYYPIPTGAPLYNYYLDMIYKKPSRLTMKDALNLTEASTGYFVVNKYWWASPKIIEEAKLEANTWHKIGSGDNEVYIFKYK